MPKRTVYFPQKLYDQAVRMDLDITAICQAALAEAVVAEDGVSLPELFERQIRNAQRMLELYRARSIEGYQALLNAGIDPLQIFQGMSISTEFIDTAKAFTGHSSSEDDAQDPTG